MKNKKITYLLLIVVVLVWGFILVRIIGFAKKEDKTGYYIPVQNSIESVNQVRDTVKLIADYPDPFLSGYKKPKQKSNSGKSVKKVRTDKKNESDKTPVRWPEISYNGIISHNESGKSVGLAIIDGNNYLITSDNTYNEVYIKELFADSIIVIYKNKLKTIK